MKGRRLTHSTTGGRADTLKEVARKMKRIFVVVVVMLTSPVSPVGAGVHFIHLPWA